MRAEFEAYGKNAFALRARAADILDELFGEKNWKIETMDAYPHTETYQGAVVSWKARVTAHNLAPVLP